MEFGFTPEEESFRQEVKNFLQKELTSEQLIPIINPAEDPVRDNIRGIHKVMARKLGEKGWLSLGWPKEYGGKEGSIVLSAILHEEMRYSGAPGFNGPGAMLGPTLIRFGTPQQKSQHLPLIARGEILWTQAFSEPEAGCDLASLQTTAKEDGDSYIINGRKVWSSGAYDADWGFFLIQTDPDAPKKHHGMTFFMMDMKTPGITVRPIKDMGGGDGLCEIFLDDVRIPRENIVGEKNQGWQVAMALLDIERGLDVGAVGFMQRILDLLVQYVKSQGLETNVLIRQQLAEMATEIETARLLSYRPVWLASRGLPESAEVSEAKAFSSKTQQKMANAAMKLLGSYGQLTEDSKYAPLQGIIQRWYLETFSFSLFGGTSEIQKTIVATKGLGLPRG